jgi:uncharacterized protein
MKSELEKLIALQELDLIIRKLQTGSLTAQEQNMDEEIKAINRKREKIISSLSSFLVDIYDRIKSRDGIALAEVRGNCCQYCHILIRYPLLSRIRKGTQITTCETCGRILYSKPVAMTQPVNRVS